MVKRLSACIVLVTLFASTQGLRQVSAFPEGEIEGIMNKALNRTPIPPALCGGLVHPGDERVLSHYYRNTDPLNCKLSFHCTGFDSFGDCIGKGCRVVHRKGLPKSTVELNCENAPCDPATSTPPKPHKSCSKDETGSRMRIYSCDGAKAVCYSYMSDVTHDSSTFPYAFNCVVDYDATPIDKAAEPAGWNALDTLSEFPPASRDEEGRWVPAPGSNATAPAGDEAKHPFDSSMESLSLDNAGLQYMHETVHPVIPTPYRPGEYLTLDQTIGRLMQPPEVKLILPSGGFGLQKTRSSLFSKIFPSLAKSKHEPEPVEEVIGNDPDALSLAAKYLREIPLIEVEYVPVEVAMPMVSRMEIKQKKEEWNAWLEGASELERTTGVSLSSNLRQRIINNSEVMDSYVALEDTVRRARIHEPKYIHALLSYVEKANEFYYDWIEKNAKSLEQWYDMYSMYLPSLRTRVRGLYQAAAQATKKCLVPACRMNVVPVKQSTKPWDLLSGGMDNILSGDLRAWLPDGPPLWASYHGSRAQWHPFEIIGTPLPDLTFDLSRIAFGEKVTVPVINLEKHSVEIISPPPLDPVTFQFDVEDLEKSLKELKRFHPPVFTFPDIDLPNPEGSLFFVPPPPIDNILTWNSLLTFKEQSITRLDSHCDPSDGGTTFLMSELDLKDSSRDPSSIRAVSFVQGSWEGSSFTAPTESWKKAQEHLAYSTFGVSLAWPMACPWCSVQRPQRIIKQRAELEVSWGALQETLLKAIDTWNAQVRFHSIVDRNELVKEEEGIERHSGLKENLSDKFR